MIDEKTLRDPLRYGLDRRTLLAAAAGLGAAALTVRRAWAADQITIADPGGAWTPACEEAFVQPFSKETGTQINHIARQHYPTVEIKANVETKAYTWDVVIATEADVIELSPQGLLTPLDWSGEDMGQIMKEAHRPDWMGTDVYATVLGYRTDKYGQKAPSGWADFWDVGKFPGRRAMHKHPIDTLEMALMADGVPMDKLYPIDMDRAFKKLEEIKPHVDVWWDGGAQTTQMLQSGEVDMLPIWNARCQVVIESGAPAAISWNQGLFALEGWVIPKGDPKTDLGMKFIRYTANAQRQAQFVGKLAYGPTNPRAYDYIPKERAKFLPTAPDNLKLMVASNNEWWGKNKERAIERFNAWLLS